MEGTFKVGDLKRFLRACKDAVEEKSAANSGALFDLQFELLLASPRSEVSSSQILSDLDNLMHAVGRWSAEDAFHIKMALPVASSLSRQIVESIKEKYEASNKLQGLGLETTAKR